jgi:hypothetical protein
MNVCSTCGLDFSTPEDFDEHRVGTHDYLLAEGLRMNPPRDDGRRCLDEDELTGWRKDQHGRWVAPAVDHAPSYISKAGP